MMRTLQAAILILLGSVSGTERSLQGENETVIATDENGTVFITTPAAVVAAPVSPMDFTANNITAVPTQPAADESNADPIVSAETTVAVVESINVTASTEPAATATVAPSQPADDTSSAPTEPVDGTTSSVPNDTTVAPTESAETTATTTESSGESVSTQSAESSPSDDDDSKTLVFDNGSQNTLDPNDLASNNNNIQITEGATLFITSDSINISGYCDNCSYPNSTIDVSEGSILNILANDITILGSDSSGNKSDAGGSAIELGSNSKAKIEGSITIIGGDGASASGVGGHALDVHDNGYVEIGGDAVLQGGDGAETGRALFVDMSSSAKINSGTFKNEVHVENGSIDVYGGTFETGVVLNGDLAIGTFYGCFASSAIESPGLTSLNVILSGTYLSSPASTESTQTTINVSLYDGAELYLNGGGECSDESFIMGGNYTTDDAESGGNETSDETYVPTFMPTGLGSSGHCNGKSALRMLFFGFFVIGQFV
eukprot:scaffold3416_cov76-Cyclotella_meneghiniana.AAC.7